MTKYRNVRSLSLMSGASLLALCVSVSPVSAQQVTDDNSQEIVVVGQRAALERAQAIKENASQIVDSISADDVGKLPDNSVTEALQRVPGVVIEHFATPSAGVDTNHYQNEGTGLMVRGLPNVAGWLNGREAFSANGSRSLSWEDVPPELMSAVNVYKSPSADMMQGGFGGAVDLRTKLPFDYKELTVAGSAEENYGDIGAKTRPGGSALFADRWMTGIGEVGMVVDVAGSELTEGNDAVTLNNWVPENFNGRTVQVPDGGGWNHTIQTRDRLGVYEALQWKPNSDLMFYQTGFRSDYWSTQLNHLVTFSGNGGDTEHLATNSNNVFDQYGNLISTSQTAATSWMSAYPPGLYANIIPEIFWAHNQTTDFAEGGKWTPNDKLTIKSDLQYTESTAQSYRQTVGAATNLPAFGYNTSGSVPSFTYPSASYLLNPSNFEWEDTMDHKEAHYGRAWSWNVDGEYDVSDTGLIRDIKSGIRLNIRNEQDKSSTYDWTPLGPSWATRVPMSGSQPGDVGILSLSGFMNGTVTVPTIVIPSDKVVLGYPGNVALLHQEYSALGAQGPVQYQPQDYSYEFTDTQSVYLMTDFADETHLPVPMNGNVGIRVENVQNKSEGWLSWGNTTVYNPVTGSSATTVSQVVANDGGTHYTKVLPSLNFQFLPTENIHWRFAANQEVSNPNFSDMNGSGGPSLQTNTQHEITGATGGIGNPNLKAETANQLDTSLEYYLPDGGQLHVAGFYKKIHDYVTYQYTTVNFPFVLSNGQSFTIPTAISQNTNTKSASLNGIELGAQKFFTFLPAPFDGFGIDANYTYINSTAPGTVAYNEFGDPIKGLPIFGISKANYNITAMYSKGPVDFRLAYNWRSNYLLTVGVSGNGLFTYTNYAGKTVTVAEPTFVANAGYMDTSLTYRITKEFDVSLQGSNILGTTAKAMQGVGELQRVSQWVDTDRRLVIKTTFKY